MHDAWQHINRNMQYQSQAKAYESRVTLRPPAVRLTFTHILAPLVQAGLDDVVK
jgi:hypothetical protein